MDPVNELAGNQSAWCQALAEEKETSSRLIWIIANQHLYSMKSCQKQKYLYAYRHSIHDSSKNTQ